MLRIPKLPSNVDREVWLWMEAVTNAINFMPPLSYISTVDGPNTSGVSAERGTIAVEVNSSTTTVAWVKTSSTGTQSWRAIV